MTTRRSPADTLNDDLTDEELRTDIAEAEAREREATATAPETAAHREEQRPMERRDAAPPPSAGPSEAGPGATDLLLPSERRDQLRATWRDVQGSFIDEPQEAVRRADRLVQDLLGSISQMFDSARRDLEGEWQRGDDVSTESLRLAFRRYRMLFDRLLSM
jgi:hypothetical protein